MTAAAGRHVVIVLGHRDPEVPGWRISADCLARLRAAERLVAAGGVDAVILSGGGLDGDGEARQMAAAWRGPAVPLILEELSRNTAENAARSLPLLRAIPGVRRVTVVTSSWHLPRAALLFSTYGRRGYEVRMRGAPEGVAAAARHLVPELRRVRAAWRARRVVLQEVELCG